MDDMYGLIAAVVIIGVFVGLGRALSKGKKRDEGVPGDPFGLKAGRGPANKRQDALFVSTFPELQPHFHPEKILQFVNGWRARTPRPETIVWNNPPGFEHSRVRLMPKSEKGQPAELLGAVEEAVVAAFILQDHTDGGMIRLGSGKFTVNLRDSAVRYWHPQREFKWSKAKGWRMINSLSDRGIDSSDHGSSFSSDSSSSSSSSSARAGAAAMAGAGGTFDGGGSSGAWDGGGDARTSY